MQTYNFVLALDLVCYRDGTAHTEVVTEQNY